MWHPYEIHTWCSRLLILEGLGIVDEVRLVELLTQTRFSEPRAEVSDVSMH